MHLPAPSYSSTEGMFLTLALNSLIFASFCGPSFRCTMTNFPPPFSAVTSLRILAPALVGRRLRDRSRSCHFPRVMDLAVDLERALRALTFDPTRELGSLFVIKPMSQCPLFADCEVAVPPEQETTDETPVRHH